MSKQLLAAIFTDHMVLQRQKNITIFGTTGAGARVDVTLGKYSNWAVADATGSWSLLLPPMEADTGLTLTAVSDDLIATRTDIALGEVWLAGGQSNMEFELSRCTDWDRVQSNPQHSIRFFYTPKMPYAYEPTEDYAKAFEEAQWETVESEGFGNWSAVGYLFAEKIQKELNVTVGIIGCNWGGTSATCWMSPDAVTENANTRIYMDDYEKAVDGISIEDQIKAYDTYFSYHTLWDQKCGQLYVENPTITWDEVQAQLGPCQWPGPMNCKNPFRPSGLYDTMIKAIRPYTLKGFLYYQGESDDHRPRLYDQLLTSLIRNWRQEWQDSTLPFLIVQLPMHQYSGNEDFKNWPIIREAQMQTYSTIKNTGLAVTLDCGEYNEIHPKNKGPVGLRLALSALYEIYHKIPAEEALGPVYDHAVQTGNTLRVYFNNSWGGLKVVGNQHEFEIAGPDKIFYPADVNFSEDSVELSSCSVAQPLFARYCWTNYGIPTLFGQNGIPLAPFRTSSQDESNLDLGSAAIQQNPEL